MSDFPSGSIPGSDWQGSSRRMGFDMLEHSIRTIASTEPVVDYVSFINYAKAADIEVVPHAALRISQTSLGSGAYMTVFRGSCPEKFGDMSLAIKFVDLPLPRSWADPAEEEASEGGPWEGASALSELRRFKDDWSQQLRLLSLELRILSDRLLRSHPNIVKLLGISFVEERVAEGDSPSALFFKPILILEEAHQDHPTLESFYRHAKLRGEDIPMDLKFSLWRDVAEALAAVHAVGVVHGDVKPDNILLFQNRRDGKLVAKLSDFGGCQPSPSHTAEDAHEDYDLLGTEYWNAPEVYDRSHQHYRAPFRDYFSFGLVGCYLLFESYPFGAPGVLTPEKRAGIERGKANWDGLVLLVDFRMKRQWPHVTSVDAAEHMRSLPEPTDPSSFRTRLTIYRQLMADGEIQLGTQSAPERSDALSGIQVSEHIDCRPFTMALAMTLFMHCEPQKRDRKDLMSRLGIFLEDKLLGANIRDVWGSGCWHYVLNLVADDAMSPWHISAAHKAGVTNWRPRVSWMRQGSLSYAHSDFNTDQLQAMPMSLRTILKTEYEDRLQNSAGDSKIRCLLQLASLNVDAPDRYLEYYLEAAELGSPFAQSLCARIGYGAFKNCTNLPPVGRFNRWLLRGALGPEEDEAAALLGAHTEASTSILEWDMVSARQRTPYPTGGYGWGTTALVVYPEDTAESSLLAAVLKGDLSALSKLLENGELLATRFTNGDTLIHVAAELDKATTITFLANDCSKFDLELLDCPNAEGLTPLATAMVHGCYEAMLALLNAGADCKRLVSTRMVRYLANMGYAGMISQLLELRDILERDGNSVQGMTRPCPSEAELLYGDFSFFDDGDEAEPGRHLHPIFASILGDNIWTLQALLKRGCSQDVWMGAAAPGSSDSRFLRVSLAPIHLACQLRPLHLAMLLRHGADVNLTTADPLQQTPVQLACTATTQPCFAYSCSRLPAENEKITLTSLTEMRLCMLRLLATYGKPNYDAQDRLGKTALHHCMARQGCLPVIQALVDDYGADLEIRDGQGMTPLHHAASPLGQELDYVKFCVSRLPRHAIDKPDGQDMTPLMWAVRVRRAASVDFCKCFVERGCSLFCRTLSGETVLHIAALASEELFTYIFDEAAKVDLLATLSDLVDDNGRTFGHIVARSEHSKIRTSLQRVPDKALVRMINRADSDGLTLLHAASQTGDAGLVEFLLRKGADINRTAKGGSTALQLARSAERSAVVRVLEEHLRHG